MEPRPSFRVTTRAKHTLPRLGFAQFRHRGSSPQLNHVRHRYIPATEDVCSVLDLGTGTYELPVSGLLVFSRCPRCPSQKKRGMNGRLHNISNSATIVPTQPSISWGNCRSTHRPESSPRTAVLVFR